MERMLFRQLFILMWFSFCFENTVPQCYIHNFENSRYEFYEGNHIWTGPEYYNLFLKIAKKTGDLEVLKHKERDSVLYGLFGDTRHNYAFNFILIPYKHQYEYGNYYRSMLYQFGYKVPIPEKAKNRSTKFATVSYYYSYFILPKLIYRNDSQFYIEYFPYGYYDYYPETCRLVAYDNETNYYQRFILPFKGRWWHHGVFKPSIQKDFSAMIWCFHDQWMNIMIDSYKYGSENEENCPVYRNSSHPDENDYDGGSGGGGPGGGGSWSGGPGGGGSWSAGDPAGGGHWPGGGQGGGGSWSGGGGQGGGSWPGRPGGGGTWSGGPGGGGSWSGGPGGGGYWPGGGGYWPGGPGEGGSRGRDDPFAGSGLSEAETAWWRPGYRDPRTKFDDWVEKHSWVLADKFTPFWLVAWFMIFSLLFLLTSVIAFEMGMKAGIKQIYEQERNCMSSR